MICSRCLGTGNWINPKNPLDKRDCFACNGTGQATLRPRGAKPLRRGFNSSDFLDVQLDPNVGEASEDEHGEAHENNERDHLLNDLELEAREPAVAEPICGDGQTVSG